MATTRRVVLTACLCALFASGSMASPVELNPCTRATARCIAGDRFLGVTYEIHLHNPGRRTADVLLLSSLGMLEKVEGLEGKLLLNKRYGGLDAAVPPRWQGRITLHVKQPISPPSPTAPSVAEVPLPPALLRTMTVDLPGANMDLTVSPAAIVRPLEAAGDRSRFEVTPLRGDVLTLSWRQLPPVRRARFSLSQLHRISEDAPGFLDVVDLTFLLTDPPSGPLSAAVPEGVALRRVHAPEGAAWTVRGNTLSLLAPDGFCGESISITCHIEGRTAPAPEDDAQLLTVPIFVAPEAERHEGHVLVAGDGNELTLVELRGASQTAAEGTNGDRWRLACDLHGPQARVVVKITPVRVRRDATVSSHYAVSAFKVDGRHSVGVVVRHRPISSLELTLPPGEIVHQLSGRHVRDWSQDGTVVRVRLLAPFTGSLGLTLTTQQLTGGRADVRLTPPVVEGAASSEYTVGISHADDVQIKPADEAEHLRVAPDALGAWLRAFSPAIAYGFRDGAVPIMLEIVRAEAEIRGEIQDHATVYEDRLLRESLFLLDVRRQPLQELTVALPSGLAVERVDGPLIEDWAPRETGGALVVRFRQPLLGESHFRLVCSRPIESGRMVLRALRVEDAPHLQGWLGISSDISVKLRPMENGWTNIASMRTDRAPAYLKGFENRFLYEFYDSRWELEVHAEAIPAVYSAEALQELRFRASQAEGTALFDIRVQQGGVGELIFELPENASGSQFQGDGVVQSRLEDGRWHVRLRGKQTGTLRCRIDYGITTGMGRSAVTIEPVRLVGAKKQGGVLLLSQARPDVEVAVGAAPRALAPVEPRKSYPEWSHVREHPALAAFSYLDADWTLPLTLTTPNLSEMMLQASIPLAKLTTFVQAGEESLNHLSLYVSNTNRQFLTIDLAAMHPQARLIGTYVYGEPVKPFRETGKTLQIPLFTSEKAERYGMSVVDVTYAEPHEGLGALRRRSLHLPGLGLNVRKFEWTVRLPEDYRLAGVGGNMDKPVSGAPAPESLGLRLVRPLWRFVREHLGGLVVLIVIGAACWGVYRLARLVGRHPALVRKLLPVRTSLLSVLIAVVLVVILAFMLMPALQRSREEAGKTAQRYNLHNIGLGVSMWRQDNNELYPPNLQTVLDEGYLDDPNVFDPVLEGQELIYRRRTERAVPGEIVAYFWPPVEGGTNVLFADGAVLWAPVGEDGQLVSPRYDKDIVTPPTLLAAEPEERKQLVQYGLQVEELAEALELEQASGGMPAQQRRAGRQAELVLQDAVLDANVNQIAAAMHKYAEDHGGRMPGSAGEIRPYIVEDRLLSAITSGFGSTAVTKAQQQVAHDRRQELEGEVNGILARGEMTAEGLGTLGKLLKGEAEVADLGEKADKVSELAEAWFEQRENDFKGAFERYAAEHDGRAPQSGRDLAPYITDIELRNQPDALDVVVEAMTTPALERARARGRAPEGVAGSLEVAQARAAPQRPASKEDVAASRYNLGLAYLQRGDYDNAADNFRRALDLKDDYEQARRQLAQVEGLQRATARQQPIAGLAGRRALGGAGDDVDEIYLFERDLAEREKAFSMLAEPEAPAGPAPADQPAAAPVAAATVVQTGLKRPLTKGVLVQQMGGGRSRGALPIAIDFPMPDTVAYEFVKPFLGRARAELSFRAMSIRGVLLAELALAACALLGYLLIRLRNRSRAVSFAGAAVVTALVLHLAAPPAVSALVASTLYAMAACLVGEVIHHSLRRTRTPSPEEAQR